MLCRCLSKDVTAGASYQRGDPFQLRPNLRVWQSQAPVEQFLLQSGPGAWRIRESVRPQAGPTLGLLRRVWAKRGGVRPRSRPHQPTKRPWLCNRGVNKVMKNCRECSTMISSETNETPFQISRCKGGKEKRKRKEKKRNTIVVRLSLIYSSAVVAITMAIDRACSPPVRVPGLRRWKKKRSVDRILETKRTYLSTNSIMYSSNCQF